MTSLRQEDISRLTGLSQAFLSMLESGRRRLTNIDNIVEFLVGLQVPAELAPLRLPDRAMPASAPALDPLSGELDPALPWTRGRMVTALDVAVGGEGVSLDRRRLLAVSGAALTAYVYHWGTAGSDPLEQTAQGARKVSGRTLAGLQSVLDELRMTDAGAGSGSLAELGRHHLQVVVGFLKNGIYRDDTGRELAAIAADTATQTGWLYFDAGAHDKAQSYFLAALRAAHMSGDVRLGAGALSYLAIHGYSTGSPRDAVTAAQSAREKIKSIRTPALESMLLTRQARGHAKLGEQQAALTALGRAAELCAQGRSEHDPPWLYWINDGEIHGQAGSCHLDLGNPRQATEHFARASESLNPGDFRTRGLFLSRAATAHFKGGDVEAGCARAHETLDLAERLRSARLDEHADAMLRHVPGEGRTPYARELLEHAAVVAETRS
ncbi:XRE family transcriptional regulator [Streptomyces sp. NPDC059991]|uniref:XRE family transcriptional regulator n=1 Tax=Streptomyces sp. NPDC059991 TaxID=3347028 RepID=UPI0036CAFEB2